MMRKLHVLVLMRYYLPGYTAGGPIRSIANMVEALGDEIRFSILTHHEDPRDPTPYRKVRIDEFQPVGKAEVNYLSKKSLSLERLRRVINAVPADLLYINSLLNADFSLKPLLLRCIGRLKQRRVLLAPRGELNPGALEQKNRQKRLVIGALRRTRCLSGVEYQATDAMEEAQIREWFGEDAICHRVSNLPASLSAAPARQFPKSQGELRLCFLSRVAEKKNLHLAIELLSQVNAHQVSLDIFGHREDMAYWGRCAAAIENLPSHVKVAYRGSVPHAEVPATLAEYDALFLPTKGENYGHAIVEALSVGTPVVISDRTPWRNLKENQAGWDCPLERVSAFERALNDLSQMGERMHEHWRKSARLFIAQALKDNEALPATRAMLYEAAKWNVPHSRPVLGG